MYFVGSARQDDVVKFGMDGRPQFQLCGKAEIGASSGICCDGLADRGFWYFHRHLLRCSRTKLHPARDLVPRTLGELHEVILDKAFRNFNEVHVASKPSVVPPVGAHRWDSITPSGIVDLGYHEVIAFANLVRDFEVERSETAFVFA